MVDGEYYRLFTSMFLHYGLLHLVLNMWVLWVLGRPLEAALGPVRFLALYLVAGLGGSVAVYLLASPYSLTAGASGAIFGLFAALIVVMRKMRCSIAGIVPVLVFNLVITFTVPGISIAGHLGGLVIGAIVAAGAGLRAAGAPHAGAGRRPGPIVVHAARRDVRSHSAGLIVTATCAGSQPRPSRCRRSREPTRGHQARQTRPCRSESAPTQTKFIIRVAVWSGSSSSWSASQSARDSAAPT